METTPERFEQDFKVRLDRALESGLRQAGEELAHQMQIYESSDVPFWSGALRSSIFINPISTTELDVVVGGSYAAALQYGSTPHYVALVKNGQPTALGEWAMSPEKMGLTFEQIKAMRSMKVGAQHPFVQETIKHNLELIKQTVVNAIVAEFSLP